MTDSKYEPILNCRGSGRQTDASEVRCPCCGETFIVTPAGRIPNHQEES